MDDRVRLLPYPDPPLTDGVVALRPWSRSDLPCLEAAATDPRITQRMGVPPVYSQAEGTAYVDRQVRRQSDGEGLPLAIERIATGEAVGLSSLSSVVSLRSLGSGIGSSPPSGVRALRHAPSRS